MFSRVRLTPFSSDLVQFRYSTERKTFGQPIMAYQAVSFMLADMAMGEWGEGSWARKEGGNVILSFHFVQVSRLPGCAI